jgi:predicted ATPase
MTIGAHVHSLTNLDLFREKVAAARRQTGRLQRELADALGIDAQVLSRKLHGAKQSFLTHAEVKQIIKALATWDAISTQDEAIELLTLMGLRAESFSEQEWNAAPLNRLELFVGNQPTARGQRRGRFIAPTASAALDHPPDARLAERVSIPSAPPLPAPSTSLIGREWLMQMLLDRLRQPSVRLLTLLGTGGVGKTRLALEVARAAQHDFADGVVFVSLATIQDAALVPSTIVQTLHLSEPIAAGDPGRQSVSSHEDVLKGFLREKELLLVLDNVEQIPDIAPFISDLLSSAAALKVMVTSRAVLHLYGEHEFDVPPLEVCTPDRVFDPDYVSQFPATRLFVERAQAVNPAFQLSESNAANIAHICARLDGLPLAIELAAVRTKVLPLPQIVQRLAGGTGQSLAFLRHTVHNVLPRHQTLHDTLDWSYKLLDPQQQCLFRRLSVFLGGWTLHAALAICLPKDQAATPDEMLEQMEILIDQSLVKRLSLEEPPLEENTEPRFHFLETIREYALGQLEACGEREDIQRRHAIYYLALAERVEPGLSGRGQSIAVPMLVCEQDNLRAALEWAIEHDEADIAQRMCGALGMLWEARTQFQEAHRWIDAALKMTQETAPEVRAKLLMAASRLALWEIACERSRELAQQALALYEAVGDLAGTTWANFQIGDTWHQQGEYTLATRYLEESLRLLNEQEDWRGYAFTLSRLGAMATLQGNFDQAWTYLSQALTLQREHSEPGLLNVTLVYLGVLALSQGDLIQSMTYLREGLLLAQQTGNRYMLAIDLLALGCLLGTTRGPSYAARVCSAAEALFESLNTALPAAYHPLYDAYLGSLKSQVDETTWQTWWAEGKALSQEELTALALAACEATGI